MLNMSDFSLCLLLLLMSCRDVSTCCRVDFPLLFGGHDCRGRWDAKAV